MGQAELRFRQVHLDFHTSEHIPGIGSEFDPEEFASTLERARVNSVTCFARCHHGYMYYHTRAFPERRHPHLTRNLLEDQIAACHARDIRVPIYTTIQWDHLTANEHPEWLVINDQGCPVGTPPFQAGFYRMLCLNSPYIDFVKAHVQELLELLPVDGFFFDIVQVPDCSCRYCRADMEAQGLEPSDGAARRRYGVELVDRFEQDMTSFVRQFNRDCSIFYNAGHVGPRHRAAAHAYTHFEIESLPGGGWGYLHFPLAVRYARTLGRDCLGMTGKFHTSWGDFHSLKNQAALQFECFQALALNAKPSIGDQLHPTGRICQATYDLIGSVYSEVERKEPWCRGASPVTEIALLTPEEFSGGRQPPAALGALRMLQEGAHQFDVIDSKSDLSGYALVVLPDEIPVSDQLAGKLEQYLADGGALVASYQSGLDEQKVGFALRSLGVALKGPAPFSPDFIRAKEKLRKGMPAAELVMYLQGMEVEARPGSEILADVVVPYFNRTYRHFCSHRHTPSAGKVGYPGIVQHGRTIYFAHPIFTQYASNAPRWCKQLFLNAVELLLPEPLVRITAPSTTVTALNAQLDQNQWVLHLLHYIPERRGHDLDTVEDVIPIFDVKLSIRAPKAVAKVTCAPEGEALPFEQRAGRVEFVLPKLLGHQMIALSFA